MRKTYLPGKLKGGCHGAEAEVTGKGQAVQSGVRGVPTRSRRAPAALAGIRVEWAGAADQRHLWGGEEGRV